MRKPFTLLITAAGSGSRFLKQGLTIPKPLIKAHGQTLLEHTLKSFDLKENDNVLITTQRKHHVPLQLSDKLTKLWPQINFRWLEIDQLLKGQLATANATTEHWLRIKEPSLDLFNPLLIHNCDTGFTWHPDCIPTFSDASMAVFQAEGTHWSFGKPDLSNPLKAVAIAEKKRISDLASIGLYGFKSMQQFNTFAKKHLASETLVNGEYYIAPMLDILINKGKHISLPRIGGIRLYGTPSELIKTFDISMHELMIENS